MKLISTLIFLVTLPFLGQAQFDASAKKYLDDIATSVQSSQGLTLSFDVKISHLQEPEKVNNESGKLLLKHNLHKLEIAGTETYSDGKNQWIFQTEDNEVTVQPIEEDELTPASIFTMYQNGYRFRTLDEDDEKIIVELSPEDKNSPYVRISLYIDKTKKHLDAFTTQGKNGMITSISITHWIESPLSDKALSFNPAEHPDAEIIDLR